MAGQSDSTDSGRQKRVSRSGSWNVPGMTPSTRWSRPAIVNVWPTAAGERAKRSCHRPSLSTTTGSARSNSSAVKVRPTSGGVPSSAKNSGPTRPSCARCGASAPANVTVLTAVRWKNVIDAKVRLCSRQSSRFAIEVPSH